MKKMQILLGVLFVALFFMSCEKQQITDKFGNTSDADQMSLKSLTEVCGSEIWTIWAGQDIDAGTLTVSNDETNIYVTYSTTTQFGNLHVWVGTDSTAFPQNSQGKPVFGQFPYTYDATGLNEYTFTIPLSDIEFYNECGEEIFLIAHAEVLVNGEWETGFGGNIPGNDNRWFYYAKYTVACCNEEPPTPETEELGTAFAYGNWVFASNDNANPDGMPSLELTDQRWGWAINIAEAGSTNHDLWVGAALNDITKGILVGSVNVDYDGTQVTVTYNLDETFYIGEAHIYASDFKPTTITPGQYGNVYEFDELLSNFSGSYDVTDTDGDGIWIIAHAVAFGEETE